MTKLKDLLQKLDTKKAELESLKPLKKNWQRKLDDKYRLEWNFHSNHIEGNTLTYGETQMLLFFGKATGEHEKREYDEMEAHDVAIKMVTEWAQDESRDITESDLRELNKIILVKPFWKEAITEDGQETRKQIIPGQYKTSPNSVRMKSGEIHHYATPEETPAKMKDLMEEYQKSKDEHPIVRAAKAHHEFTAIHPFDDGNGRVSRLWVNYIMLRAGYPPLIIRVDNKEAYLTALQKADTGDLVPFIEFLIAEMEWSLNKAIDAAHGQSLEEPGDLDKKLALLKKEIAGEDSENDIKMNLTYQVVRESLVDWGSELFDELAKVTSKFNEFYDQPNHRLNVRMEGRGVSLTFRDKIDYTKLNEEFRYNETNHEIREAEAIFQTHFAAYKKSGINPFGCSYSVRVIYDRYTYEIHLGYFDKEAQGQKTKLFKKNLLHKPLTSEEIGEIALQWGNTLFEHLDYNRKKNIKQ
ncbi:hypothetical protein C900_00963 [Fulvivirga imtechensis AK7]|uniref:Fido domain-containing protein n=1 Tax=Fulvivirga imtechensis AK7 TaxID=1237149 RepID=L8JY60_9BACT|nr:Fic family protein [Fulvivirga imtechensis]ELR72584.1 hypothetical protein C900_00963 [Fulvivirga imtechensis AK7]